MKLEDHCISLELAKRLKELGVRQESLFYWRLDKPFVGSHEIDFSDPELRIVPHIASTKAQLEVKRPKDSQYTITFSAFTVAELGGMLPTHAPVRLEGFSFTVDGRLTIWRFEDLWQIAYNYEPRHSFDISFAEKTEADARAKMLIHLIEKGIVKP